MAQDDHSSAEVPSKPALASSGIAQASLWILDRPKDLLLIIATPVLILPVAALVLRGYSITEIGLFVAAFGAFGHHLPGMLRAYGDRELLDRFDVRFFVAPIFLLSTSFWFSFHNLKGLEIMLLFWGLWHGLAQVYGFLRIYDAKVGTKSEWTSRLDMWMCIAWFGAGFLNSPDRAAQALQVFYSAGGPLLPGAIFQDFVSSWNVGTAAVTAGFLVHTVMAWRSGQAPSPVKLITMATSFGFWWYSMVVSNVILGIAMFEVFHDVQYLTIVWVYNRRRVDQGHGFGKWTGMIFRPSLAMIGMYVGTVFAYGYLGWMAQWVPQTTVRDSLLGLVTASTFLHFYYDGFIWKVRERATREGLGLAGGLGEPLGVERIPAWISHGAKWSAFVVPAALLAMTQQQSHDTQLDRARAVVEAVPASSFAQNQLGVFLTLKGEISSALEHLERAVALGPDNAQAHFNLGRALLQGDRTADARALFEAALRVEPRYAKAHSNLGIALVQAGEVEQASRHFDAAEQIDSSFVDEHFKRAHAWARRGSFEVAALLYERSLERQPDFADAHYRLAVMKQQLRQPEIALVHYERAAAGKPGHTRAQLGLAWLLATSSDPKLRDGEKALAWALRAAESTQYRDAAILGALAAAHAEAGDFDGAVRWESEALKLSPERSEAPYLAHYRAHEPYRMPETE